MRGLACVLAIAPLLAGCATVAPCVPIAPHSLPNGAGPGAPVVATESGATVARWGGGENLVSQRVVTMTTSDEPRCQPGEIVGPGGCYPPGDLQVRGVPAVLLPVGDQEETSWILGWGTGGCRYEVSFGRMTRAEAEAYAARY